MGLASGDGTFFRLQLRQRKWWVRVPFLEASAFLLLFGDEWGAGSSRLAVRGCLLLPASALGCRKEESWDWQVTSTLGIKVLLFDCSGENQTLSWSHIPFPPSSDPNPALATMSLSPSSTILATPPLQTFLGYLVKGGTP